MSDPRPSAGNLQDRPEAADDGRLMLTAEHRVAEPEDPNRPPEFDPDTLRLMVREILQDELRGGFGARVTRGVRRLVRAEVAALLAARDLRGGHDK